MGLRCKHRIGCHTMFSTSALLCENDQLTSPLCPSREVLCRRSLNRRGRRGGRGRRQRFGLLLSRRTLVDCSPCRRSGSSGLDGLDGRGWRQSGRRGRLALLGHQLSTFRVTLQGRTWPPCQSGAYSPPLLYFDFTAMSSEISLVQGSS